MADKPVNVDGVRAMMGSLADDMTDDHLRRALAVLAAEYHPHEPPEEVAAGIRRFAAATERLQRP